MHYPGANARPESQSQHISNAAHTSATSESGIAYALAAYGVWGFAPIYWKITQAIPPEEILSYRVLWSLGVAIVLLAATRSFRQLNHALRSARTALPVALSSLLLGVNWLTFIYAVQTDRVLATSLGYYINPLANVLLGLFVLGERLTRAQGIAISIAAVGVAYMAIDLGELPWISLVLATSFGLYGLVRKVAPAEPLAGFGLEMLFIAPLAAAYLVVLGPAGRLPGQALGMQLLVAAGGIITAIPLLCFASAARRLPLSTLGFFQYIAPSLAFVIAIGLYGEPLTRTHLVTFGCVWLALGIFSFDSFYRARSSVSPDVSAR